MTGRFMAGFFVMTCLLLSVPGRSSGGSGEATSLELTEVELADDDREMARGLMFRRELCDTCGMLFVYPEERILGFWMKNTILPLDMIFMDEAGRIVTIHRDTEPLRLHPPYTSRGPARYVLEVKAGFARRAGLAPGQKIDLKSLWDRTVEYRMTTGQGPAVE